MMLAAKHRDSEMMTIKAMSGLLSPKCRASTVRMMRLKMLRKRTTHGHPLGLSSTARAKQSATATRWIMLTIHMKADTCVLELCVVRKSYNFTPRMMKMCLFFH